MKASHRNTLESIPWLVTGRVAEEDRYSFEKHLNECGECRAELAAQKQIHAAMNSESPRVDYAPGASLQKLWNRIDSNENAGTTSGAPVRAQVIPLTQPAPQLGNRKPRVRFAHWLAAAVVIESIGLTFMAANMQSAQNSAPYSTVTSSQAIAQSAVLRVVFAADLAITDVNALLRAQQLTVVDGPTSAGVYTLATASEQDLPKTLPNTLATLRSHPGVRFAEPIGRGLEIGTETKP